MVMGSIPEDVDLAVIGAGVGGYVAAIRAAELGMNVALVEKEKLGGHCLNYACIPSKTLINIADTFYASAHSQKFGINVEKASIDAKKMYEWRMSVSKKLEDGVATLCKLNGIEAIKAEATFISPNTLQLTNGTSLQFKNAVIATGSDPAVLPGFEFNNDNIIDYKKALMLDYVPESMAIIGAGYVAVEIGTLYAKLGTKVAIIARSDVLSKFDRDAVAIIKKRMQELGISIYTGSTPSSFDGKILKLSDGSKIDAHLLVVSVGLTPYTKGLGLENTKVTLNEKGFVKVDSSLRTTDNNIFAVGDVIGEPMLAHKAIRQGVVVAEIIKGIRKSYDNLVVPSVIFSDPEIAIAGSVEEREGIKVTKFPLTALGRSIALDTTNGFVKIANDENGIVKGVEIVSQDANAMITEAALAIEMGATVDDIASTIHPHPTYSEAVQEAAEAALGNPIHYFYGKSLKVGE
ncbi:MAG: dihydrolipoyl dehydrogenase [Candidatus Micrarchaeaceae archaeon]